MQRPIRHAACEPCRLTKQACGHEKPVCERCRRREKEEECIYRERPFKKRRLTIDEEAFLTTPDRLPNGAEAGSTVVEEEYYPKAGYLGLSSHHAIFSKLTTEDDNATPSDEPSTGGSTTASGSSHRVEKSIHAGAEALTAIVRGLDLDRAAGLIRFWLAKGTSLALGGPFLPYCIGAAVQVLSEVQKGTTSALVVARRLATASTQALAVDANVTFETFCESNFEQNVRWETIVFFLVAAGRASADVSFYPALYIRSKERHRLQRAASTLADKCLEIALSLDSMNDLLLLAQYENWILFTTVSGDHSLDSWRRCGDVIGSLLFLGYHEEIKSDSTVPPFLTELRRAAFAQIYSDDKNVAVFLGRPPRLSRRFCCFQLPHGPIEGIPDSVVPDSGAVDLSQQLFETDVAIEAMTGLRWTAACALLKEEALDTLQNTGSLRRDCHDIAAVHKRARAIWTHLPAHLRLEGSLDEHRHRTPFELDFLVNARLTYLQVLFLLHGGEFLQCPIHHEHERPEILKVSMKMLALVVEAVVRKDHLVNSGTSLVWKVVHYGLPAAGLISLWLISPAKREQPEGFPSAKVLQDLSVFVAEIQGESLVSVGEPNFALLHRAACSIQGLLQKVFSDVGDQRRSNTLDVSQASVDATDEFASLAAWLQNDSWGYDEDFWKTLEDHALSSVPEHAFDGPDAPYDDHA